jgi:outer membrane protein TolC
VSKAYYTVLVNRERLGLLRANLRNLEQLLKDTRALYAEGFVEEIDVDRLEVNLNNTQTELDKAERLVKLSLAALKFQMGMVQSVGLELTDSIRPDDFDAAKIAAESVQARPELRPEYRLLEKQIELTGLNIRRYKAEYMPTVYANGGWQRQSFANDFKVGDWNWFNVSSAGFTISMPLFNGFATDARIQRTKIEQMVYQSQLDNFAKAAQLETEQARIELANALRSVETQQRNVKLAEKVYRVAQLKYKEGLGTNLEVVEAETQLSLSQTNYTNALLDAYIARINLQKAIGALYADRQTIDPLGLRK